MAGRSSTRAKRFATVSERDPSLTYAVLTPRAAPTFRGGHRIPSPRWFAETWRHWVALSFNVDDDQSARVIGLASTEVAPFGVLIVCMRGFHVQWGDLRGSSLTKIGYLGMRFGPVFAIAAVITGSRLGAGLSL